MGSILGYAHFGKLPYLLGKGIIARTGSSELLEFGFAAKRSPRRAFPVPRKQPKMQPPILAAITQNGPPKMLETLVKGRLFHEGKIRSGFRAEGGRVVLEITDLSWGVPMRRAVRWRTPISSNTSRSPLRFACQAAVPKNRNP